MEEMMTLAGFYSGSDLGCDKFMCEKTFSLPSPTRIS